MGQWYRRPRAARAGARVRRNGHHALSARVDLLEPRMLLAAADPVISEFLAVNNSGITDRDGERSDWIEIHNPGTTDINLDGYFLTDEAAVPNKWRFPAVTLPAGAYKVVFASGKDVRTGNELHTNFNLSAEGEYLALVAPDGARVLTQFDPFPRQLSDVSYGSAINEDVTGLVGPAAPLRVHVPVSNTLGTTWRNRDFVDTGWTAGTSGVGFDLDNGATRVPGYALRMVDIGAGTIVDLADAVDVLETNGQGRDVAFDGRADATVLNLGWGGNFPNELTLPNGAGPGDAENSPRREQYALRATADVFIPAGDWSLNVHSDDGFRLVLPGVAFIDRFNANDSQAPESPDPAGTLQYGPPRAPSESGGFFTIPAGGLRTTLLVDFHERGGNDTLELSVAAGHFYTFGEGDFRLLADGELGWSVTTVSTSAPPDFNPLINTNVATAMHNRNATAYVRVPFSADEEGEFDFLRLRMKYDDGFVAYVNGVEVARRNAPGTLAYNSQATAARPTDADGLVAETITVSAADVRAGNNVLAIQGLNESPGNYDFLIVPELEGVATLASADRYFSTPTPGSFNGQSDATGFVSDTRFSRDRGFYDEPFDVTITTDTPGAEIRYTTDGSTPTATGGILYTGPVRVDTTTVLRAAAFKAGNIPSNVDTQTYLFLNDVIRQTNSPPSGFPEVGAPGMHWDYEMDPLVVDDPAYSSTIINDLKSIPSLSLVMDPDDLFGSRGIYTNPGGSGIQWERAGSSELIIPTPTGNGRTGFQVDSGVRIYGGVSRSTSYAKHTFRLIFRGRYGASKLKYDWFDGTPEEDVVDATDEFDTIILRGNFNKSWPFWVEHERQKAQYIHDQFISASQLAMGRPSIHGTYVHLYVNGVYWGLYNPVERPAADFAASYNGGEKEQYDALNSSEPVDGTKDAWNTLMGIANGGLSSSAAYANIRQYLDVDNLIDYMIVNFYGGNIDWDDHNWYAARKREPGAGYQFYSWDAERTLEDPFYNRTGVNQNDKPSRLYAQLRQNAEFRLLFADHVHEHFFNGGVLTPEKAAARYMELAAIIDRAIVGESARWGDRQRPGQPYTRDNEWMTEQNRLLNEYFPVRTEEVLNQLRAINLYPSVAAPVFSQHGGMISQGFTLTMTRPGGSGDIYYTVDGSDPRLPGGGLSTSAIRYTGPVSLSQTTTVRARVRSGTTWSALTKATFTFDMAAIRVTEVMYHPALPPAGSPFAEGDFEYVEIMNTAGTSRFIGGVRLRGGVDATVGNMTLAAGQRAVIVKNRAAFESRYGTSPGNGIVIAGTFTGSLDDAGEQIRLEGALGQPIL
ncbi:MAG TPA: FN3 associated domain-containing protein, partial [Tepidisphaeraceae bacterium]|nr:FN3 associated domain-containing protein [Tepidisphaeraceae bacterium]